MPNTEPKGAHHPDRPASNEPHRITSRMVHTDNNAKNARLRLMKERNERYLAEQRAEVEADEEGTQELHTFAE